MSKSIVSRYGNWIIYLMMYLAFVVPVLYPFSPPMEVGEKAKTFYNVVQGLPANPRVLMCWDYGPDSYPLYQGVQEAFLKHVFSKGGKVIGVTFGLAGPMMYQKMLSTGASIWSTKKYGVDWVFLGFIPGGETGLTSFLGNIRSTISTDWLGNSIDSLPMMKSINSAKDMDAVFNCETETTLAYGFVRQISSVYGVPLLFAPPSGQLFEPYYPKQLAGLLYPMPGAAAEYEVLLKAPGNAAAQMAISFVGCLFYVILLCTNVLKVFEKRKTTK